MDREDLREYLNRFYRFGSEVVRQGGCDANLGEVYKALGDEIEFSILPEHVAALRQYGIDGRDLWAFSSLLQETVGGGVPLQELRMARHMAYLELVLFDASLETDDSLAPCAADIMATIREAGCRLTTSRVLSAMEAAGRTHGESTIKIWLAKLKQTRQLVNDNDGRGYGLPDWP